MLVSKEARGEGEYIIHLSGKMTFTDTSVFSHVLDVINQDGVRSVIIDLAGLEFIDSAGLGMFFIAKEDAETKQVALVLQGATGQIQKMFTISCFYEVFQIR